MRATLKSIHSQSLPALAPILVLLASPSCSRQPPASETKSTQPGVVTPTQTRSVSELRADSAALIAVAGQVLPAVVSVASTRLARVDASDNPLDAPFLRRFFGPSSPLPLPFLPPGGQAPESRGLGSGVIVGKDLILTNAHVIEGAKDIEVTAADRRTIQAKLVGSDPKSDLAVLRITGDTSQLKALEFADSSKAQLGQMVLAVGNPFGVGQTVTMGIVSATSRADLGIEDYEDFIQTDAAINPGNSGGALVDLDGKLLGIPTAILSRSGGYMGVGFAIPSNMAQPILKSLVEHGRVIRSYLGVTIQNLDHDLAKAMDLPSVQGVLISDVAKDSPAAKSGIRRGDVILRINGRNVDTTGQLRNTIATAGVDAEVKVELLRDGKKQELSVKLAQMPDDETKQPGAEAPAADRLGVAVTALDAEARQRRKIPAEVRGVLVTAVEPSSPAANAGLRPGDVIQQVDRQDVTTPEQLSNAWEKSKGTPMLLVWRDQRTFFAVIKRK